MKMIDKGERERERERELGLVPKAKQERLLSNGKSRRMKSYPEIQPYVHVSLVRYKWLL